MVCIDNQQLDKAGQVHQLCIQAGLHPDAYAYNALINAYGCGLQVGVLNFYIACLTDKTYFPVLFCMSLNLMPCWTKQ